VVGWWQNFTTGFPRGIESTEKVMNFKIDFQDLEKVLNFAKMYVRYRKSTEILYRKKIYLSRISPKAKHFIVYAVLCNV